MGKKIDFTCKVRYAKVTEADRDMGNNDGSDMDLKIKSQEGIYNAILVLDDDTAEYLKEQGIPAKGLSAQLWKTTPEGDITYKVKRPHVNPKIIDEDTGKPLYYGPPKVLLDTEDGNIPYNQAEHGFIANDNEVKVRLDLNPKWGIVTLEVMKFLDFEAYLSSSGELSEVELEEF